MPRRRRLGIATSLLAATLLAGTSCEQTSATAVDVNVIRIEPDSVAVSVGSTATLEAALLDARGNVLAGRTIAWSSDAPAIATVDGSGAVTALEVGRATITATSEGITGEAVFVATPAPSIDVEPGALAFSVITGAAVPPAQTVAVRNGGTGTLSGLGTAIVYGDAAVAGWLTASLDGTTAPATLTAAVVRTSLPPGIYEATIRVSMMDGSDVDVPVTYTVEPPLPSIVLDRTSAAFALVEDGTRPPVQTIAITNGGGRSLTDLGATVTYDGSAAGWLDAGVTPSTAPGTLTLSVNTTHLEPGRYGATVQVVSPVADNSPRTVAVDLTVSPAPLPPAIALSATSVSFGSTAGGADPAERSVSVTNGGDGVLSDLRTTIRYGGGQPTGWLSATPAATTAPTSITLRATTGALPAGTYEASVDVTSPVASNSPRTIDVTFTVDAGAAAPAIVLSRTSVSFGGAGAETVTVGNGGGGSLTGLDATVSYAGGQPGGWLSADLAGSSAPTSVALTASAGALEAGTYDATVAITSPVADNSPQTIAVTLTVISASAAAPNAPTELKAEGRKGGKIEVTWKDRSDDETGFVLEWSPTGSGSWADITLPADTEKYRMEDLHKGDELFFRVRACNEAGCSSPSNTDSARAG